MEEIIDKHQALSEIYQKLKRRRRIDSVLSLVFGVLMMWLAFRLNAGDLSGFLSFVADLEVRFVLPGLGGAALASAFMNWSGTNELKLAEACLKVWSEEVAQGDSTD